MNETITPQTCWATATQLPSGQGRGFLLWNVEAEQRSNFNDHSLLDGEWEWLPTRVRALTHPLCRRPAWHWCRHLSNSQQPQKQQLEDAPQSICIHTLILLCCNGWRSNGVASSGGWMWFLEHVLGQYATGVANVHYLSAGCFMPQCSRVTSMLSRSPTQVTRLQEVKTCHARIGTGDTSLVSPGSQAVDADQTNTRTDYVLHVHFELMIQLNVCWNLVTTHINVIEVSKMFIGELSFRSMCLRRLYCCIICAKSPFKKHERFHWGTSEEPDATALVTTSIL